MTCHKAQGGTYSQVIVDLESCIGTKRPYVMISRVKTLDGLVILHPFAESKIMCRQSQDVRIEMNRLQLLHHST
ncbi:hypothetical protein EV361DRAFT_764661, partial [Lentinula raphanica]